MPVIGVLYMAIINGWQVFVNSMASNPFYVLKRDDNLNSNLKNSNSE